MKVLPPQFRGVCPLALVLLAWIVDVSSAPVTSTITRSATKERDQKRVLSINAANGAIDWGLVEAASTDSSSFPWFIDEITLDGFGPIMTKYNFQSALDSFEPQLRNIFSRDASQRPPDTLIVASKGVNILTFLAIKGLWRGPSIVLSPIPNACDHIDGSSWETEWKSTMSALVSHHAGPLVIGVGTSSDEQFLIVEMMEETHVCGRLLGSEETKFPPAGGFFETCPTWLLQSFPGNHSWKNNADNAPNVAMLINRVFEIARHGGDQEILGDYRDL